MNINKFLYAVHFLLLIFALLLYEKVVGLEFLSSKYRVEQFSSYPTYQDCPQELTEFTYCLRSGNDKPRTLILGDSSLLAFANSLTASNNVLSLGGGSCPMLSGLSVSFSEPICLENTTRLTNIASMPIISDIEEIYLIHRSEYLDEIDEKQYIQAVRETLDLFSKHQVEIVFVLEPKRMLALPGQCIERLLPISKENCHTSYSKSFNKRKLILSNEFSQYKLVKAKEYEQPSSSLLLNNYKDSVHITTKSFPCYYGGISEKFGLKCLK